MKLLWWRREPQKGNESQDLEKLTDASSDKLIEVLDSELDDASRRINISKAKYRALVLREQDK